MTTKDAAALYARIGRKPPPEIAAPAPEHIRGTRRKTVDGIQFRSTLEAETYQILKLWQDAGAISQLELQPRFVIQSGFLYREKRIKPMYYTPDFAFIRAGENVAVEAKGFRTEPYRMRRKMFLQKYGATWKHEEWTNETVQRFNRP